MFYARLDGAGVGFDVDHVADFDALLMKTLVDARVELQLLRTLRCLQRHRHVRHRLAIACELST